MTEAQKRVIDEAAKLGGWFLTPTFGGVRRLYGDTSARCCPVTACINARSGHYAVLPGAFNAPYVLEKLQLTRDEANEIAASADGISAAPDFAPALRQYMLRAFGLSEPV